MAYDQATGNMLLFGGNNHGTLVNGTWTWDGTNWTHLTPIKSPSPRWNASMAYDPATGNVVLWGGYDGFSELNDTWTWNGTDWTQLTPATSPPARDSASMAFDSATGNMVLFDHGTWTWDGTTWTQLNPASSPPDRGAAGMTYDPATGNMVLFGGYVAGDFFSDTWTWDGATWTERSPSTGPTARWFPAMAYDPSTESVILYGGSDGSAFFGDTWSWTGTTWDQLTPADSPAGRFLASMDYDPTSTTLFLYGGNNAGHFGLDESWNFGVVETPTVALDRYVDVSDSSVHWAAANASEVPAGFTEEGTLGNLLPNPEPGLLALYSCKDGGEGNYLSTDQSGDCEADSQPGLVTHSLGIEGYIYASEPAGFTDSVQLYRCFRPSPFDHLVTTIPPVTVNGQQRCGEDPTGYTYEGSLGWIVAVSPPANTPEVPNVLILPALALGLIGTATWVRRRRMAAKCVELR